MESGSRCCPHVFYFGRSERQVSPRRAGDRHVWSWCSHVNTHIGVSSQNGKLLDPVSFCPSAGTAARVGWRVLRRLAARTTCTQLARRVHAASMPACVQPGSSRHQAPLPRSGGALARGQLCIPSYRPARLGSLRVAWRSGMISAAILLPHSPPSAPRQSILRYRTPPTVPLLATRPPAGERCFAREGCLPWGSPPSSPAASAERGDI